MNKFVLALIGGLLYTAVSIFEDLLVNREMRYLVDYMKDLMKVMAVVLLLGFLQAELEEDVIMSGPAPF